MGKKKNLKEEALRVALRESLEKDRGSVVKIRSHIKSICTICTEDNVEPETLLFEASILKTLAEVHLQKKIVASASKDGHEISENEENRLKKEFFQFCDVIDVRGHEAYITMRKQPSLFEDRDASQYTPSVSNKERPNYIQ